MTLFATSAIEDLTTKVKTVSEFSSRGVLNVYSEDDFLEKTKMMTPPFVGVMYEGLRANSGDPSRQGMAADLQMALVLAMTPPRIGNPDTKNQAAEILDSLRRAVRLTVSPTQHKWRFVSELYMGDMGGVVLYVQRWSTAAILT